MEKLTQFDVTMLRVEGVPRTTHDGRSFWTEGHSVTPVLVSN